MYYVWLGGGLGALAFDGLTRGKIEGAADRASRKVTGLDTIEDVVCGISRSDVAACLSQAHGPWLLHLGARERLESLKHLATMYSGLDFRRKETYILRELLACLLDLLIQGREEARSLSETILGSAKTPNSAHAKADVGIRGKDNTAGNDSILRLQQYICEVHGLDLTCVDFVIDRQSDEVSSVKTIPEKSPVRSMSRYTWPELQIGLLRESLEIAEALPGALHTLSIVLICL